MIFHYFADTPIIRHLRAASPMMPTIFLRQRPLLRRHRLRSARLHIVATPAPDIFFRRHAHFR